MTLVMEVAVRAAIIFLCNFSHPFFSLLQCVSLNDQWPKAHVRLAAAYIALGGHSNDACLSLQRALSLDRNNKVARDMLVKEMRQRNNRERTGSINEDGSSDSQSEDAARDLHPTEETPQSSSARAHSTNGMNYDGVDVDDISPPESYHSLTFSQRIHHHFAQFMSWFYSQSDDIQTLLKVGFCFLVLYVALGGRFGLDYALGGGNKVSRGNYGEGNAYDRYSAGSSTGNRYSSSSYPYKEEDSSSKGVQQAGDHDAHHRTAGSGYNDRSNSQNDRYYSRYDNGGGNYYEPRGRRQSTSYHMPNLHDGSMLSIAIFLGIGFICHRFGINPFQVFFMLNLMQGRGRRGRMGYGGYGGGFGGGFGGGGFGFGRQRFGYGRRRG